MEETKFEQVFQQHNQMIFRITFLNLKNEADVLDVVQNTFIILLKRIILMMMNILKGVF